VDAEVERASADARLVIGVLRKQAAECFRLADEETQRERRAGFLSLAESYEQTARAMLQRLRRAARLR
jgi:hypothetical protein